MHVSENLGSSVSDWKTYHYLDLGIQFSRTVFLYHLDVLGILGVGPLQPTGYEKHDRIWARTKEPQSHFTFDQENIIGLQQMKEKPCASQVTGRSLRGDHAVKATVAVARG